MDNIADAVARLLAEAEISKLIYTYPRGLDRLDREILLSIGSKTATVEFTGMFNGTWPEFVDWLMKAHTTMLYNRHTIGNVLIDIRGEVAVSETTATANLIVSRPDGNIEERITHSRYLDNWSREHGRWLLARRHTLRDRRTVKLMSPAEFAASTEYVHAADVGRPDPSYAHFAG
jgi:hypothetical protein